MSNKKIEYKDLNGWLKIAVVSAWVIGAVFVVNFIIGFIQGVSGY
tara:strand:+ start:124 stop:258 length:135 start_codon:yes stop_codon:yes gene_type:complete